jgi:pyrimidine-specific ribonucleoside hydrolase
MKNLVLDVDTGIDDAIAIILASMWTDVSLLGISCVSGNVSIDKVLRNTLGILKLVEREDVPVARGAKQPLVENPRSSSHVHGEDGIGDLVLPMTTNANTIFDSASDLYKTILNRQEDPVTFVALAPLTNLALFIRSHPNYAKKINEIVFMGGAINSGNASAVAEFNVWHDPEAAHIVLTSGIPITMYSLDAFEQVEFSETETLYRSENENFLQRIVRELLDYKRFNIDGTRGARFGLIGDAGALITAVKPELATIKKYPLHVNLTHGIGRGQTQVDKRLQEGEDLHHNQASRWPEINVVTQLDRDRAIEILFSTIGRQ